MQSGPFPSLCQHTGSVYIYNGPSPADIYITFTFSHLADAFIQSDIQRSQIIHKTSMQCSALCITFQNWSNIYLSIYLSIYLYLLFLTILWLSVVFLSFCLIWLSTDFLYTLLYLSCLCVLLQATFCVSFFPHSFHSTCLILHRPYLVMWSPH